MIQLRRTLLKVGGAIFATTMVGMLRIGHTLAATWNQGGFESKVSADAMKSLGATGAAPSKEILISAPDIAENGAQVPVTITSKIANTESISIIVDKNPFPLCSTYDISNGAEGYVSTKLKMGQTSNIVAVVKAGGKYFTAAREVKVTIGGCGG